MLAAYSQCKGSKSDTTDSDFDEYDMQQCWLRNKLRPWLGEIERDSEPTRALIYKTYEFVHSKMLEIINTKFGGGHLVLVGGIQINMPAPFVDHFMPMHFEVLTDARETIDLLPELGSLPFSPSKWGWSAMAHIVMAYIL